MLSKYLVPTTLCAVIIACVILIGIGRCSPSNVAPEKVETIEVQSMPASPVPSESDALTEEVTPLETPAMLSNPTEQVNSTESEVITVDESTVKAETKAKEEQKASEKQVQEDSFKNEMKSISFPLTKLIGTYTCRYQGRNPNSSISIAEDGEVSGELNGASSIKLDLTKVKENKGSDYYLVYGTVATLGPALKSALGGGGNVSDPAIIIAYVNSGGVFRLEIQNQGLNFWLCR